MPQTLQFSSQTKFAGKETSSPSRPNTQTEWCSKHENIDRINKRQLITRHIKHYEKKLLGILILVSTFSYSQEKIEADSLKLRVLNDGKYLYQGIKNNCGWGDIFC